MCALMGVLACARSRFAQSLDGGFRASWYTQVGGLRPVGRCLVDLQGPMWSGCFCPLHIRGERYIMGRGPPPLGDAAAALRVLAAKLKAQLWFLVGLPQARRSCWPAR